MDSTLPEEGSRGSDSAPRVHAVLDVVSSIAALFWGLGLVVIFFSSVEPAVVTPSLVLLGIGAVLGGTVVVGRSFAGARDEATERGSEPIERELSVRDTTLLHGSGQGTTGTGTLTDQRVIFTKTPPFVYRLLVETVEAPTLQEWVAKLAQRRTPLLELPLASLTRIERTPSLGEPDRIGLYTTDQEYIFLSGWADWAPLIRETLTVRHGRRIDEVHSDAWKIEQAAYG